MSIANLPAWWPSKKPWIIGDCLDGMKKIPDKSVDLILTDPPYGHNNNNNGDLIQRWEKALGKGKAGAPRAIANDGVEANQLFQECIKEYARILKSGCCCCCCCGGGGGPDPQFARWSLWMDEPLEFKQMVVWDKGPMGMGWHYRRSYETVLVAQKRGAACKWYDTTDKVENIIRHIRKIIPNAEEHPTIKPVKLMIHFIELHTKPGDVVLDPFLGSGTTLMAARKTGRIGLGFEINPEYEKIIEKRSMDKIADITTFEVKSENNTKG